MKRRIFFWLVVAAAIWLVSVHASDIAKLWVTMRGGDLRWLLAAAVLQVVYYACTVGSYREAFAAVGVARGYGELVPVVMGAMFMNVVMPSSGTALMVDDAARRGHSGSAAAAAVVLAQIADFGSFSVIMVVGFAYLAALGRLAGYEVLAAAVLLALIALFAGVFVLAVRRPAALTSLLRSIARAVAWLAGLVRRPAPLAEDWPARVSHEFTEASRLLAERPAGVVRTAAWGLSGYLLDFVSFVAVGFAFGWTALGSLLAAYAVGVLVWVVSIIPQGIGVVEGAIALMLASFGAAASQATAISLVFRGMGFWIPLAIGFVLLRRVRSFVPERRDEGAEVFTVRGAAVLTAVMGLADIVAAVRPGLAARFARVEEVLPAYVSAGHLAAALSGVALLMLSRGLWRRKRTAWAAVLVVLGVSAVGHLVKGHDIDEALVAGALFAWLLTKRDVFHARPDRPSLAQGLRTLVAAVVATLAYGTIGFYLLDRHFSVNFGLRAALRQTAVMFTQFYDPGLEPLTGFGRYFADSIYVVGALTFAYALVMLLRPVLVRAPATAAERARAGGIVRGWGRSTLASTTLLPDKSYWFSDGGSVVAFVVDSGIALALGDPIGPADDLPDAVAGFCARCGRNGWTPVFYQVLPDGLAAYETAGLRRVKIGVEAIVDVRAFSLAGKSHKAERNRINHLEELGFRAQVHEPPLPPRLLHELRNVSDAWLTMVHGSEKRFSLGWFDDAYIRACPAMAVHAPDGRVVAFANVIPEYRLNEGSIDLMRRLPEAPPGTMDLMFVRLIEWCAERGYDTFNLGLSSLAGVGEAQADPAAERLLHVAYERLNQFYSFKGLHEYKEKFDPRWEPRYLIYPAATELPAVLLALVRANGGADAAVGYLRARLRRLRHAPA